MILEYATLEEAAADVQALNDHPFIKDGGLPLPRCDHPRWGASNVQIQRSRRGPRGEKIVETFSAKEATKLGLLPAACSCKANDLPALDCAYATWTHVDVTRNGSAYFVPANPEVAAILSHKTPRARTTQEQLRLEAGGEVTVLDGDESHLTDAIATGFDRDA